MIKVDIDSDIYIYYYVLVIVISLFWLKFRLGLLVLIFMKCCVEVVGSSVKIDETWSAVVLRVKAFSVEV